MRKSLVVAVTLTALSARAEYSLVNIHLDPAVGVALRSPAVVSGVMLKVDFGVLKSLPLMPQVELFGLGAGSRSQLADGGAFGAGLGLRLRLFNDENGSLFAPGESHRGNAWGNLWVDAHVIYSGAAMGVGFDAAAGYEFSLVDGFGVGPFAKFFLWSSGQSSLLFGLSFTVGAPSAPPRNTDWDDDGFRAGDDKCPEEAGPASTGGCPEPDGDGDKVIDRLDRCPAKKGEPKNHGCPWVDADRDGLVDPFDNCPADAAPAENRGCPGEVKQLVELTVDEVVLKAPVQFEGASVTPESLAVLGQVAEVLNRHSELVVVQVGVSSAGESQLRADGVREVLVSQGVAAGRLKAVALPSEGGEKVVLTIVERQ